MTMTARRRLRLYGLLGLPALALGINLGTAVAQTPPPPPPLPPAVCQTPPPPASTAPVRPGANALPHRAFPATWQRTLDKLVANGSIPGAVIIVKSPDWGVRVGVAGEANLVSHQKMSPDMQFRVGSVTKAFMAQAIMRLEQEGKLKLSAGVLTYLGDNEIVAGIPDIDKITVADLLQMTSGINNYLEDYDIKVSPQITPRRSFTANELVAPLSGRKNQPPKVAQAFPPGYTYTNPYWLTVLQQAGPKPANFPAWNYTNTNYTLLGMIAEEVTGLPAAEVMRRYVLDVAGLKDTFFATDLTRLPAMHGYTKTGSIPYPQEVYTKWCDVTATDPTYAGTAGAIVSTPWDLLKFSEAMFESNTLLNEGTKNKWYTFVSADIHEGWEPMQYGMGGLMQPERSYGTARGHGGAFPGYKTLLYYFFDQKTSFILASNTWDHSWEGGILEEIMPQVSSAATTPRPVNGATSAMGPSRGSMRLAWQAGRVYGDRYDVYWGTDPAAVDRASAGRHPGVQQRTVKTLTADVPVKPGTTYYWRVDTVAPGNKELPLVIGPTWQFRTR